MNTTFHYIGDAFLSASLAAVVVVLALVVFWWCHRKQKPLGKMLAFFVGIIALATTVLGFWHWQRMIPVRILNEQLVSPYGKVALSDIRYAKIDVFREYAPLGLRDRSRMLYIEEANGKIHAFSELDYPIDSIKVALDDSIFKR